MDNVKAFEFGKDTTDGMREIYRFKLSEEEKKKLAPVALAASLGVENAIDHITFMVMGIAVSRGMVAPPDDENVTIAITTDKVTDELVIFLKWIPKFNQN